MMNSIEEWKLRLWQLMTWEIREEKIDEVRKAYEEALGKHEETIAKIQNVEKTSLDATVPGKTSETLSTTCQKNQVQD